MTDLRNQPVRVNPLITRVRFQLPGALVVALLLPVALRTGANPEILASASISNTILATLAMIVFGYFAWRRLERFPTVEGSAYVFWAFIPAFLLTVSVLLIFRLEYSRSLLIGCFILSVCWFLAIHFTLRRNFRPNFAIVPFGKAGRMKNHRQANWSEVRDPEQFEGFRGNIDIGEQTQSWYSEWGLLHPVIGLHGIVADLRHDHAPEWESFFAQATLAGVPVYHYKTLEEQLTGRVSIEHLSENSFGSLLPDLTYLKVKQLIDFGSAILLLPLLLPLIGLIAVMIALIDGRPVFFIHERVGYRSQIFKAIKFRTMNEPKTKADRPSQAGFSEVQSRYTHGEKASATEAAMTKENDQRVTRLGRVLRKSRLDELPQLFNILKGEMSWIGPRPEAVALSRLYLDELSFYTYRHAVRPGITGWAQVNQGHVTSVEDVDEKLKLDFYYIKHISPWLDLLITLKTMRTMISGFGAK